MPYLPSKSPDPEAFDYTSLDSESCILLQQKTLELKNLIRRSAQEIVQIGERLTEVKSKLGHGSFRKWLKSEFDWSVPTARRFMRVYDQFKCFNLNHLNIAASALYLLAEPSVPHQARQESMERSRQGEVITYKTAKEILFHHTIDVEAETVEEEVPAFAEVPLVPEPPSQPESLNEPSQEETLAEEISLSVEPEKQDKNLPEPELEWVKEEPEISAEIELVTPPSEFEVGDRVRIRRRQHGKDNWAGKTARTWQINPDGWLRVDVEGHKRVKFTLKPNWVEPMPELSPEQQDEQLEPVLDEGWADEPDPEPPAMVSDQPSAIADIPLQAQSQGEAHPQFQAGDRLHVTNLGQQNQQWCGEVAEVLEVTEAEIKVTVRLPRQPI